MSSPQETQGGASAFSAWLSQVSEAVSAAFQSPVKAGPAATQVSPADKAHDGADPALQDGLQSGRSSRAGVAGLDVSSMDPQERLEAIRARLAQLGLTDEEITERLSTIPEESEEMETELLGPEESRDSTLPPQCTVSSYGDDEDHSTSSDSEEEIIKQFEISVSRSQSFRSGVAESGQPAATAQRHKFTRLLSDQEEGDTEPSDCEEADGLSRLSRQDPLTYKEDERVGPLTYKEDERVGPLTYKEDERVGPLTYKEDERVDPLTYREDERVDPLMHTGGKHVGPLTYRHERVDPLTHREDERVDPLTYREDERCSLGSQDTVDRLEPSPRKASAVTEGSLASSHIRRATEASMEMETAVDNLGYDNNEGTDSSSTWSPEEQAAREALSQAPSSHHPISRCGDLIIILDYKAEAQKLLVTVVMARDIPDKERSGVDSWQVHVVLLPGKKQRHKTSVQRGSAPRFSETFRFSRLDPAELGGSALRFRLYAVGKMVRERMMGERLFRLSGLSSEGEMEATLVLEPRSNMKSADSQVSLSAISQSDSASSTQSLSHGGVPELLIGLAYNATTGRLSVELIKGSHFRNLAINRPPDTFGKMTLLNSMGQEISRCKTSIRRGQPNPVYKETFVFQVALFQLSDVTLMISIYNRRSMKRKEMVGWISMGQNSSGEEEQLHWQDMKESHGQQVCRWHVLLES